MNRYILLASILVLLFGAGCSDVTAPTRDFSQEVQSLRLDSLEPGVYENEVAKLKSLADNDNPIAQYRYANILLEREDLDGTKLYLKRGVALGEMHSAELLGFLYIKNEDPSDDVEGFELLTEAAESGLAFTQFYLGSCFSDEECALPRNTELSYYWLKKAYENGQTGAKFLLEEVSGQVPDKAVAMQRYDENVKKVICEIDSSKC
ncbi:sel1 repeat family protein [Corallincola holothuriorum]|uniref:Sel1 repeat family protein n=1 Tax=Corallincola holothuriorum TaxID=2282215 RepID=A0A368N6Q6_9GAMM|nr:sel1 repeat family protein [Corallincola holothuriorum]RCU45693.1 sel1 repeat family protein [Corallincola holothuriorum]